MVAVSRLPEVLGADGLSQQLQPTDVLYIGAFLVSALPTGVKAGSLAYASNGRAITGVGTLGGGFTTQVAGAGTGCLVTFNGSAWQIAGTNATVAA